GDRSSTCPMSVPASSRHCGSAVAPAKPAASTAPQKTYHPGQRPLTHCASHWSPLLLGRLLPLLLALPLLLRVRFLRLVRSCVRTHGGLLNHVPGALRRLFGHRSPLGVTSGARRATF